MRFIFSILGVLFLSLHLQGQDLHSSNYRYAPLYLNPALAGHFPGTMRLGGNYRDQGRQLLYQGYQSGQAFMDMPLAASFRDMDWSGIGFNAYSDQAGLLPVTSNGVILSLSHHLSLDKKQSNILSGGIQYGFIQRKLNEDDIVLESDHVDPGVQLTDRNSLLAYEEKYNDLNAGIHFRSGKLSGNHFQIGISAYHLIQTNAQFLSDKNFYNRRFTLHSLYKFELVKGVSLQPEIIVSMAEEAMVIMPQVKSFFKLKKDEKNTDMFYAGAGYRYGDAMQVILGMNFQGWDFGFAYDVTVSSASNYNQMRGGLEVGISRIFSLPQKPKTIPVRICTRM